MKTNEKIIVSGLYSFNIFFSTMFIIKNVLSIYLFGSKRFHGDDNDDDETEMNVFFLFTGEDYHYLWIELWIYELLIITVWSLFCWIYLNNIHTNKQRLSMVSNLLLHNNNNKKNTHTNKKYQILEWRWWWWISLIYKKNYWTHTFPVLVFFFIFIFFFLIEFYGIKFLVSNSSVSFVYLSSFWFYFHFRKKWCIVLCIYNNNYN